MKECTKCKISKPVDQFRKNGAKKDGLQSWCIDCMKLANANHYKNGYSKVQRRLTDLDRRRKQEFILEYLSEHPCVDCNESDTMVLEFDHLRDKVASIARMINNNHSIDSLQLEIAKCEVVCANCHRRRTYRRCNSYRCN